MQIDPNRSPETTNYLRKGEGGGGEGGERLCAACKFFRISCHFNVQHFLHLFHVLFIVFRTKTLEHCLIMKTGKGIKHSDVSLRAFSSEVLRFFAGLLKGVTVVTQRSLKSTKAMNKRQNTKEYIKGKYFLFIVLEISSNLSLFSVRRPQYFNSHTTSLLTVTCNAIPARSKVTFRLTEGKNVNYITPRNVSLGRRCCSTLQ